MQTLLVPAGRDGVVGLLPGWVRAYPGEHSLKLGTPGLKDGRPLAFKAGPSVYDAIMKRWADCLAVYERGEILDGSVPLTDGQECPSYFYINPANSGTSAGARL